MAQATPEIEAAGKPADAQDAASEQLIAPLYKSGRFANPWPTWKDPTLPDIFKFSVLTKNDGNVPKSAQLNETLPVLKPSLSDFDESPATGVRHLWIGHATSLLQFDGLTILTDPVFSQRCSPVQFVGEKRYRPVPCTIQELPKLDCIIISHNHYDHLDYNSVVALNRRFGDSLCWYVPMHMKSWFSGRGCKQVVELTWWEEHLHSEESQVRFISTPCQHWCKRTLTDTNKALWCSWTIIGPKHRILFAGDTGYCDVFTKIGEKYGPYNLCLIPIGAYHPRWFLCPQHVDPKEAVQAHIDLKSQKSIGIHWGTFQLTKEFYLEPKELLKQEAEKAGLDADSFITVNHGEVQVF